MRIIYSVAVFKNIKSNKLLMFPMGFDKDGIRIRIIKQRLLSFRIQTRV